MNQKLQTRIDELVKEVNFRKSEIDVLVSQNNSLRRTINENKLNKNDTEKIKNHFADLIIFVSICKNHPRTQDVSRKLGVIATALDLDLKELDEIARKRFRVQVGIEKGKKQ